MKIRNTGILNSSMHETPADKAKSEAKYTYINKWKKNNPESVLSLEKYSKEELINLLIYSQVGDLYDKAMLESLFEFEDDSPAISISHLILINELMSNSTEVEKHLALAKWETEMIARAGNNTIKVAEIARTAGATRVQIKERLKIKAFKVREENLKEGRSKGAQAQKDHAAETKQLIGNINSDLLKNLDTARWTLEKRAEYIEKILNECNRKQNNGKPYKVSTIKLFITGKR